MEIQLGPYRMTLGKDRTPPYSGRSFSPQEMDNLLSAWSPLPNTADPSLLADVTVDDIRTVNGARRAQSVLGEYGIVVVPQYFDRKTALAAGQRAFAVASEVGDGKRHVAGSYAVEIDSPRGYYDLASDSHATANLRTGADAGMLDIFNYDKLDASTSGPLRGALAAPEVMGLIPSPADQEWWPSNLNVYVNSNVTHTRGFHVDSYGDGQVKAFLYLTDVDSTKDGPYSYVVGSHRAGPYRDLNLALTRANKIFQSTDTPLVDPTRILPVIAPAGSLVVSNQSGFHRGYPQAPGHRRSIAVLNIVAWRR